MKLFALCVVLIGSPASAALLRSDSCAAEDLKHRVMFQNKLAGDCEEMCKEVGAFPKKCTCPGFVQPDSTPGVMTWEELNTHMDNLVAWGKAQLQGWSSQAASAIQKKMAARVKTVVSSVSVSKACAAQDLKHRAQVQNKLASACEDMCKEIGAYPDCECPDFVQPDSTPGVMTWEELLEHMDNLVAWSVDQIKSWKGRAAEIQLKAQNATKAQNTTKATNATKATKTCSLKNMAGEMDADQNNMVLEEATFTGAGQVAVEAGSCPSAPITTIHTTNGGASDSKVIKCATYPCCMRFCCGQCMQR
jgi:hypothetical protein